MITLRYEIRQFRQDGTARISIVLTQQGRRIRIPTSITVTKNDLTKGGKIRNAQTLQYVNDIINDYRRKANAMSLHIGSMTLDEIADRLTESQANSHVDFLAAFRQYIDEATCKGIRNYKAAYNSLVRFIGRDKLDTQDITYTFLDNYAHTLSGRTPSLYIGAIRHVFQWARLRYNDEERGILRIPYNPFERFRVPRQQVAEKLALSAEQIRSIFNLPYQLTNRGRDRENRYNIALDCFRLSFSLAGMNAADLYDCTSINGNTIHYYRVKTRDRRADRAEMQIDIPWQAMPYAQRYLDALHKRVFRFYRMYKQENDFVRSINIGLKDVGKAIGIEGLKFYAARHSWATIARNDLNIDKDTINEALNHVDRTMTVTDTYIKRSFHHINEANKKVVEYITEKSQQG